MEQMRHMLTRARDTTGVPDGFWIKTYCVPTHEIAKIVGNKLHMTDEQLAMLEDVKRTILEEPYRYRQSNFGGQINGLGACETACCLAGHMAMKHPRITQYRGYRLSSIAPGDVLAAQLAEELLPESADTDKLFAGSPEDYWPRELAEQWVRGKTELDYARVAAARINHFVANGE